MKQARFAWTSSCWITSLCWIKREENFDGEKIIAMAIFFSVSRMRVEEACKKELFLLFAKREKALRGDNVVFLVNFFGINW